MNVDRFSELVHRHSPRADLAAVRRAFQFAAAAHEGQYRVSGEDYIEHPIAVAGILAELELDTGTLVAGLLHDVVEDTSVTMDDLKREFGPEVAQLVDGVTKLGRFEYYSQEEQQVENLRKMFIAMARDIRVILIKLADRLHNMRTLAHLSSGKQRLIAQETLQVYAPLAHRLGIFRLKWELEDLALRYMEPQRYRDLVERVAKRREEREAYIARVVALLRERLTEAGIGSDIQGRPKHFFSIYKKMYEQGRDFSEIYDLTAVRVIVESVRDCYATLGIIHTIWKPVPGRFKDFIAMPKPNMYQSLHTTVIGPEGEPVEIQIRTREMHRTAEHGIAAHWRYKEGGRIDADFDRKLAWLRQTLDWQNELRDAREFMESLTIDAFTDEVFVFTPKGDVVDLPAGSCPIDFAYRIHTDVGHRCAGAKVNGRIVTLDHQLTNGDIVEIITNKHGSPSWDWLGLVKTPNARNRIRQWFKKERRPEYIEQGRAMVEREAKRHGLDVHELWRDEWVGEIADRLNCQTDDDLMLAIGCGAVSVQHVVNRLREEYRKKLGVADRDVPVTAPRVRPDENGRSAGISVRGIDNVLVRFSRCCNPIPGDDIIGYITRGRGISIHRCDCPGIGHLATDPERMIDVEWEHVDAAFYPVAIAVTGFDRPGLLSEVAQVIAEMKTNIISAKARTGKGQKAVIDLVVEIRDLEELDRITNRLSRIRDVSSVDRVIREVPRG